MIKKINFLYIAIIVIFIFGTGFALGYLLDFLRINLVEKETKSIEIQFEDFLVTNELMKSLAHEDCKLMKTYILKLAKQTEDIGKTLEDFETKGMSRGEDYQLLVQRYFLYEIRYWLSVENYKKCDENVSTILFFYGNNDDSIKQGYVLNSLKSDLKQKVFIFSFNINIKEIDSVELLKAIYEISGTPSLVINSKQVFTNFVDLTTLKEIVS